MNRRISNNNHRRHRTYGLAVAILVAGWLACWAGYVFSKHLRWTTDKLSRYEQSLKLAGLSPAERARLLHDLVAKLDSLSPDERRRWHFDNDLFRQLTDEEKSWFIDAVMPAQMKVALSFFEKLPKEKRDEAIDDALKNLREQAISSSQDGDTTNAPFLSPELETKVKTMGLNTLYGSSSAQTKVELAPLLTEVQRQFESGQMRPINGF